MTNAAMTNAAMTNAAMTNAAMTNAAGNYRWQCRGGIIHIDGTLVNERLRRQLLKIMPLVGR
jgi:hypothetical protein